MNLLRVVLLLTAICFPITSMSWVAAHGGVYHGGYAHADYYAHPYGAYRAPFVATPGAAWYSATPYVAPHCAVEKKCYDGNCITHESCY